MNPDGSFSLSTWVTGFMFIGGLAAGPGYYIYCVGFSGKNAGSYSMQWQGSRFRAVTVPLDPSMNPIAMEKRKAPRIPRLCGRAGGAKQERPCRMGQGDT